MRFWCVAILSLSALLPAVGQTFEVAPVAGWTRISKAPLGYASAVEGRDDDTTFRNGYSYGARITVNTPGYWGHELTYLRTEAKLRTVRQDTASDPRETKIGKVRNHQLSYNFLAYWMPKNERFRPFLTVGLEARRSGRPDIEGFPAQSTLNYGVNYGWGIKIRLFSHSLLRFDLRENRTGKPYRLQFVDIKTAGGTVRQQQASVGIALTF